MYTMQLQWMNDAYSFIKVLDKESCSDMKNYTLLKRIKSFIKKNYLKNQNLIVFLLQYKHF